jgi:enoyl-CoA hydratase/carnithine racemase
VISAGTGPDARGRPDRNSQNADEVRDGVHVARAGHVVRVTIDRPAVLNAIGPRTARRLNEIWDEIEADRQVWCVVLTGAGDRAFCAGADMSTGPNGPRGADYWLRQDPNGFGGLGTRRSLDVPVIARVNGYALGGGMELALGCDIVLAASTAQFGLTEPRVGRVPLDGGIVELVRRVPRNQAMGLLLTGRRAPASELHQMGLVNEVAEPADLDATVERWIQDILACAPLSLRAIKQVVQRTEHLSAADARRQLTPALADALASRDAEEGLLAFREKRSPRWAGR